MSKKIGFGSSSSKIPCSLELPVSLCVVWVFVSMYPPGVTYKINSPYHTVVSQCNTWYSAARGTRAIPSACCGIGKQMKILRGGSELRHPRSPVPSPGLRWPGRSLAGGLCPGLAALACLPRGTRSYRSCSWGSQRRVRNESRFRELEPREGCACVCRQAVSMDTGSLCQMQSRCDCLC